MSVEYFSFFKNQTNILIFRYFKYSLKSGTLGMILNRFDIALGRETIFEREHRGDGG